MLFAGRPLAEAVVDAQPVPNMLELFRTLRAGLPGAAHFVLSARPRSMRRATLTWLWCHGVTAPRAVVCFVPTADAKPQVWAQLGRDALLVIVDDLTHDHESGRPIVYAELVESARRIAHVYVGVDDITWIKTDPGAVAAVAERTAVSLTQEELSQSGHA
jgi:hypothetical protein